MVVGTLLLASWLRASDSVAAQLRTLAEQNQKLQRQVQEQQQAIERLRGELTTMRGAGERQERELRSLQEHVEDGSGGAKPTPGRREHEIRISGQAGVALFKTGSAGQFPNT